MSLEEYDDTKKYLRENIQNIREDNSYISSEIVEELKKLKQD